MRRFRTAGQGIVPAIQHSTQDNYRALFRCNESSSTAPLYGWHVRLSTATLSATQTGALRTNPARPSFFTSASFGSREIGEDYGWFDSGAFGIISSASLTYSFGGWFRFFSAGTMPFLTYSDPFTTPLQNVDMQAFALHMNPDGTVRYLYDSTASTRWDIPVGKMPNCSEGNQSQPAHIAVVTTSSLGGYRAVDVYINGQRTYSASSLANGPNSNCYTEGNLVIGADYRMGASSASPYLGTGLGRVSDLWVRNDRVDPAWIRQVYADGVRRWDEWELVKGGNYKTLYRVLIEDQDGDWLDLSNHFGRDWVQTCSTTEAVDGGHKKASVTLHRWLGRHLNLSPMDEESRLNVNQYGSFEELLDNRRRIRIETAMVPQLWPVQGWEWDVEFDGFVDTLEWSRESVEVQCIDRMAPLIDQFQLDPKWYPYYTTTKHAEDHLQDLIDDNIPNVHTSAGTIRIGYRGGDIQLYTPNSTGWAIRYDEALADTVANNLQRIADQNAWDVRWRHNDFDAVPRLTYSDPNRTRTISSSTAMNYNGLWAIRTVNPHGLVVGQRIFYTDDTADIEGTHTVMEVLDSHNVAVSLAYDAGLFVGANAYITYAEHYVFEPREVMDISQVNKDIADVRNYVALKYLRESTACSYLAGPVETVGSSPYIIRVKVPLGEGTAFKIGDEFTVQGIDGTAAQDALNVTVTVGSTAYSTIDRALMRYNDDYQPDAVWLYSSETIGTSAASSSTCGFRSDIIKYRQYVSYYTPSIAKYGMKPCAIHEGSTTNIYNPNDAARLGNRVLSDLQEPNTSVEMKVRYIRHLEINDWIGVEADPLKRWSSRFTGAITSIRNEFKPEGCYSTLGLRYSAPTKGAKSAGRIVVAPTRPALPVRNEAPVTREELLAAGFSPPQFSVVGTKSIRVQVPYKDGTTDERYRRVDRLEVHVSTQTSGFIPNRGTLAGVFADGAGEITQLADGTDITAATATYIKLRWLDVYGNPSTWTSASVVYPRINPFPEAWSTCSAAVTHTMAFRRVGVAAAGEVNVMEHPGMCYVAGEDKAGANSAYVRDDSTFDTDGGMLLTWSSASVRQLPYTVGSGDVLSIRALLDDNAYIAPQDGWYNVRAVMGVGCDFVSARTIQYDMAIVNATRMPANVQTKDTMITTDPDLWLWWGGEPSPVGPSSYTSVFCHPTGTGMQRRKLSLAGDIYARKGDEIAVWILSYNAAAAVNPFFCDYLADQASVSAASGALAHSYVRIKLLTDD